MGVTIKHEGRSRAPTMQYDCEDTKIWHSRTFWIFQERLQPEIWSLSHFLNQNYQHTLGEGKQSISGDILVCRTPVCTRWAEDRLLQTVILLWPEKFFDSLFLQFSRFLLPQSVTSQEPCRLRTCCRSWVGNFSLSSWNPLSHPFLQWSLLIPPLLSHMQQQGRKKTKPSSVPVDMWLCLAFWILLSVRISSYVFFTRMTVFLFPWQPQHDQIDSPLKAADDKRH